MMSGLDQPPLPSTGQPVPSELVPEDVTETIESRCRKGRCDLSSHDHKAFTDEVSRLAKVVRQREFKSDACEWYGSELYRCTRIKHPKLLSWTWWANTLSGWTAIIGWCGALYGWVAGLPLDLVLLCLAMAVMSTPVFLFLPETRLQDRRTKTAEAYMTNLDVDASLILTQDDELVTYSHKLHGCTDHDGLHPFELSRLPAEERVALLGELKKRAGE